MLFGMLKSAFTFFAQKPEDAVIKAALKNDAKKLAKLLQNGAPPDAGKNDLQGSAFIRAAAAGNLEVVKVFAEKNIDVNAKNYNERSALHEAIVNGRDDVALFLLDKSPELTVPDRMGHLPMESAIIGGHKKIALKMIAKGFDVEIENTQKENMQTLIARAGWDDDGWKAAVELIAQKKREAAENVLRMETGKAARAAELKQAIDDIATVQREIVADGPVSFKKQQKQAVAPR